MLEMLSFSSNCKKKMMKSTDCGENYKGERYIFVSKCMRQQFQPDLPLCAAAKLADMSIILWSITCVSGGY